MTEIIYENQRKRSDLENHLFRLQRMEEQGYDWGGLPDAVYERLKELVEQEEDRQLELVRERLRQVCQKTGSVQPNGG